MRKSYLASIVFGLTLTGAMLQAYAAPKSGLDAQATVKMPEARSIALKAYPGKIVKEELEKESGGSGLRYTFDIQSDAGTHEVGVDAKDGKILENSVEGTDKD